MNENDKEIVLESLIISCIILTGLWTPIMYYTIVIRSFQKYFMIQVCILIFECILIILVIWHKHGRE